MNKPTESLNTILKTAKISLQALRASDLGKKLPDPEETLQFANERIVASLKKLGLVSREELEALEARVAQLEEQLAAKARKKAAAAEAPAAETQA